MHWRGNQLVPPSSDASITNVTPAYVPETVIVTTLRWVTARGPTTEDDDVMDPVARVSWMPWITCVPLGIFLTGTAYSVPTGAEFMGLTMAEALCPARIMR
jgi:hypothetical protein